MASVVSSVSTASIRPVRASAKNMWLERSSSAAVSAEAVEAETRRIHRNKIATVAAPARSDGERRAKGIGPRILMQITESQ